MKKFQLPKFGKKKEKSAPISKPAPERDLRVKKEPTVNKLDDIILDKSKKKKSSGGADNKKKIIIGVVLLILIFVIVIVAMKFLTNKPAPVVAPTPRAVVTPPKPIKPVATPKPIVSEVKKPVVNANAKEPALSQIEDFTEEKQPQKSTVVVKEEPKKSEVVVKAKKSELSANEVKSVRTKSVKSGIYYLQIASTTKYPSKRHLNRLEQKGFDTKVIDVVHNAVTFHRLMVGPYGSKAQANQALSELKGALPRLGRDAFVLKRR